jgi:hypothetical protein
VRVAAVPSENVTRRWSATASVISTLDDTDYTAA